MVSDNVPTGRHHGAPKHGDALLAGLVRCRRCGRKLTVRYTGTKHNIPRYSCWLDNGEPRCIAFGGLRVDDAIEEALLRVVEPGAIAAAVEAEAQAASRRDQVRDALMRDLEAARYSADRAFRQYDAIDPRNRLVARNWSCDGTGRLRVSARSRAGLPRMLPRHRSHHFCRQYTSPRSPPISRQCGRRRRRMQGSRSASFAPSSGRWSPISMTKRQR